MIIAVTSAQSVVANSTPEPKLVAITIDDLPYTNATPDKQAEAIAALESMRRTLVQRRTPAIGFVNERNVSALGEQGPAALREWLRSGLDLGNHGATHADSNDLSLDAIRIEIIDGEATIVPLAREVGRPIAFYRFGFNHIGDTEAKRAGIATLLAERGYRLAASTIDTSDYAFDQAYTRAAGDRQMQRRIEAAYLDHSLTQIRYYRGLNRQVLGRNPPEIMLIHANLINAATLNRLISLYRSEGYRFISLADAMADRAYLNEPAFATRFGPMWGYRWARERRVPIDGSLEQEPPAWLTTYAQTGQIPARR